jgi:hypothetical protein
LAVTPRDGKLLGSATIPSGKLYVFDSFNLEVPYPHVELLPGIYPEGYVVCDNLEVRHIAKTDFEWWRDYPELRDGIPMSLLSPWDLFLPGQFDLEAYEEGPVGFEGKLHCRVYTEDGPDRVKYWAATKQAELATNTWLADIYGIEQLNEKRTLSAFEFLFGPDSVLKGRVTVVVTGNGVPSFARKRLYDFFHQERLVGSILIFIDRPANIIGFIVLGPNYWLLEPGQDPDIVRQNA